MPESSCSRSSSPIKRGRPDRHPRPGETTHQCGLVLRAGGAGDDIRGAAGGGDMRGAETVVDGGLDDEGGRDEAEFAPAFDRLGGAILPRGSVLTSMARSCLLTSR